MTRSWVVRLEAKGSTTLFGGVMTSRSSRFGSVELASQFLATAMEIHEQAGIPALGGVIPSPHLPEIFVHCGEEAQAIGGHCPGCGKMLTDSDARKI